MTSSQFVVIMITLHFTAKLCDFILVLVFGGWGHLIFNQIDKLVSTFKILIRIFISLFWLFLTGFLPILFLNYWHTQIDSIGWLEIVVNIFETNWQEIIELAMKDVLLILPEC